MTKLIRTAFGLEASANILGAIPMFLFPKTILSLIQTNTHFTAPSPISASMLQWVAALIVGLTPQLIYGMQETPQAILSRRTVYLTLLAGEGALVAAMGIQGYIGEVETGLSNRALGVCAAVLLATSVWRVYVLGVRPELLGEEAAHSQPDRPVGRKKEL